jgi:hypothetical protein
MILFIVISIQIEFNKYCYLKKFILIWNDELFWNILDRINILIKNTL